jgi:ATP/maltotriose-dependent transcriptional regulator MalT
MRLMILDFRFWIAQQPGSAQNKKSTMYTDNILAGFGNRPSNVDNPLLDEQSEIANPTSNIQHLVEPLSERERDVLRLLSTELTGPEIARELIVSLSTIRTHTSNIYDKLGVTNRRAAVRRAAELDLF